MTEKKNKLVAMKKMALVCQRWYKKTEGNTDIKTIAKRCLVDGKIENAMLNNTISGRYKDLAEAVEYIFNDDKVIKELPIDPNLEDLTFDDAPVLRRWDGGQYKCRNLRLFVEKYALNTGSNPTARLVSDYLIKENGEAFTPKTIKQTITIFGNATKKQKAQPRHKRETKKI